MKLNQPQFLKEIAVSNLKPTTTTMMWLIYMALLGVLLPHTAWAFSKFEPTGSMPLAWALAFTFEAALALFTHLLAQHIENARTPKKWHVRLRVRYLNGFGFTVFVAWLVSSLANIAHSVEFAQDMEIFAAWGVSPNAYAVAFGAVLPLTSLLFARALSNKIEDEQGQDGEVVTLNTKIKRLNKALAATERAKVRAEAERAKYKEVAGTLGKLLDGEKKDRIRAAYKLWPELSQRGIGVIAEASASYVHETLKSNGTNGNGSVK